MMNRNVRQPVRIGDVVFVSESGYEQEWWFNWPGIVRKLTQTGTAQVEFMGFERAEKRTVSLSVRLVQHLLDKGISARVAKIVRQLRAADADPDMDNNLRNHAPPKLLEEDEDESDDPDDLLN
jgi:hypothetical protein